MKKILILCSLFFILFVLGNQTAHAETKNTNHNQPVSDGFLQVKIGDGNKGDSTVKLFMIVAILSLSSSIILVFTHYPYVIIVLSMTRQALGVQNIPPNAVLNGLALFIAIYMMFPVAQQVYKDVWVPLGENKLTTAEALAKAEVPLKKYMLDNTYEKDLTFVMKLRDDKKPTSYKDVSIFAAVPAFTFTQIEKGLFTGMMIFASFIFIDMVIGSLLMYMGMMMLPPTLVSIPFKILIFIYLGGFSKITEILFKTVQT